MSDSAWRLVPVEPTEEMVRGLDKGLHEHWPTAEKMARAAHAAMLRAAPPIPDEIMERMAVAMHWDTNEYAWNDADEMTKEIFRSNARAALAVLEDDIAG